MFVRLTQFALAPERTGEVVTIYHKEIAPVIQQQPGIINVMLLEPVQSGDDFISLTVWESESDTRNFEASEIYREVFGKIKAATVKAPNQKYYSVETI